MLKVELSFINDGKLVKLRLGNNEQNVIKVCLSTCFDHSIVP